MRNSIETLVPRSDAERLVAAALLAGCEWAFRRSPRRFGMVDEELGIALDIFLPLGRNVIAGEDRIDRACRKASVAVNTFLGVDPQLLVALVDAIDGAFVHAGTVFYSDARLADYVSHSLHCNHYA